MHNGAWSASCNEKRGDVRVVTMEVMIMLVVMLVGSMRMSMRRIRSRMSYGSPGVERDGPENESTSQWTKNTGLPGVPMLMHAKSSDQKAANGKPNLLWSPQR